MGRKNTLNCRHQLICHLKLLLSKDDPFIPLNKLKQIKSIIISDRDALKLVFDFFLSQLHKDDSRIRFKSFSVMEYIFPRSKFFRDLVVADLSTIIKLTIAILPNEFLPIPLHYSKKLRSKALNVLKDWKESFGAHYPELCLSINFLKGKIVRNSSMMVFNVNEIIIEGQSVLIEREMLNIKKNIEDTSENIEELVLKCNICFELLIPKLKDFYFRKKNDKSKVLHSSSLENRTVECNLSNNFNENLTAPNLDDSNRHLTDQIHSNSDYFESSDSDSEWNIVLPNYNILQNYFEKLYNGFEMEIELKDNQICLELTSDNQCIIANLKNYLKIINNRYIPEVLELIKTVRGYKNTELLTSLVSLKEILFAVIDRAHHIEIYDSEQNYTTYLLDFNSRIKEELFKSEISHANLEFVSDPTSFYAQVSSNLITKPNEDISFNFENVNLPTLYYGADFSQKDMNEAFDSLPNYEGLHNYWCTKSEKGNPSDAAIGFLKNRIITYIENPTPIEHTCEFPLGNGKMCGRKDKYICPFHGRIISRNFEGTCIDTKATFSRNFPKMDSSCNEFKNLGDNIPNLTKLIKTVKSRRKYENKELGIQRMHRAKHSKMKNNLRSRLEKILFAKSNIIKVSNQMNSIIQEQNKSNFIYNFNYALKK